LEKSILKKIDGIRFLWRQASSSRVERKVCISCLPFTKVAWLWCISSGRNGCSRVARILVLIFGSAKYLTIHDTNHTIRYDFTVLVFDYLLFSVLYIVLVCKCVSMIPVELFTRYKTINVTSLCSVYILENLYIL
jgi:hypothetical protein